MLEFQCAVTLSLGLEGLRLTPLVVPHVCSPAEWCLGTVDSVWEQDAGSCDLPVRASADTILELFESVSYSLTTTKQVIRVQKLVGLPPPALELLARIS